MRTADTFKALGDPVRLRLFYLISIRDELCVCHLTEALGLPQSTVSRHLGILRHAGLVATRRDGKWMYYRLAEGAAIQLASLIPELGDDDVILQKDSTRLSHALVHTT